MRQIFLAGALLALGQSLFAQEADIPAVYPQLSRDPQGLLQIEIGGVRVPMRQSEPEHDLQQFRRPPVATAKGLEFDFGGSTLSGTLFYGLIDPDDSRHPLPVYFHSSEPIVGGRASIDLGRLSGRYDMTGWEKSGHGTLGFRVVRADGMLLHDGKADFAKTADGFASVPTLVEGPFVNLLDHQGATLRFEFDRPQEAWVEIGGKRFDSPSQRLHELAISGLEPDSLYEYVLHHGGFAWRFSLRTAPRPGSRAPFTFAYASDSRSGNGGGERDFYGTNAYIMKKIAALAVHEGAVFMQFTGDLINGYAEHHQEMRLQYANWKRAVEPFWHHMPIYAGMGNHEALNFYFIDSERYVMIDQFPFADHSAESLFAEQFTNPTNGPESEDGAWYDPRPRQADFPSYSETAFHYRYDNVAVVSLNSDYLYAPTLAETPESGGNLHGYLMDRQMEWLAQTLKAYQQDPTIDHIFVTQHTPAFPNGGHMADDMWYNGNNAHRPVVAGQPAREGIIQRRDQYLELLVNQTPKVAAILTGDEHNYNRLHLGPGVNIYPPDYPHAKIELSRPLLQINNGAAGAPYYAQETGPWSEHVRGFSTQNALVFFHVHGPSIEVEVLNPVTLERVDAYTLR